MVKNDEQDVNMKRARIQLLSFEKHVSIFYKEKTGNIHEFKTLNEEINIKIMNTD